MIWLLLTSIVPKIPTPPPDPSLVRAAQQGDRDAFEALVKQHQGRIYSLIWKQTRNKNLAEDLTQDTFIRAYRSLKNLKDINNFCGWLTRIALNVCNSWYSSRAYREYSHSELDDDAFSSKEDNQTPESIDEFRRILGHISTLDYKYREVIILCVLESYSYSEAAETLGIPVGTVASRMHVALQTLRRKLGER